MRLNGSFIKSFLPSRPQKSHKGNFGRVLIIAGSEKMSGAAVLCARAALKVGAGIVALALPKNSQCIAAAALPEMLTLPLSQKEGAISKTAFTKLKKFIQDFSPSVILIGPGLAQSELIVKFLKTYKIPCVIDADALNAISREKKLLSFQHPCICTPHPKEMERLLKKPVSEDEKQRILCARELSKKTGAISVLKGFGTVLTDGEKIYINPTGGPALAKGGSGDVLAGMLTGLWAQSGTEKGFTRKTALEAAACAVYLHGLCADLAAKKLTDRCVLAGELLEYLPQAFRRVMRTGK